MTPQPAPGRTRMAAPRAPVDPAHEHVVAVPGLQPVCAPQVSCYDVYSTFFVARGQIMLDGLPFVFYSVLDRIEGGADGGIHVIQRSRGTDG